MFLPCQSSRFLVLFLYKGSAKRKKETEFPVSSRVPSWQARGKC